MKGKPYQGHPPYSVVAEFSVGEEMLAIEQRDFPEHWHRIGGLNFGVDYPAPPSNRTSCNCWTG
jgi:hypothetical protein